MDPRHLFVDQRLIGMCVYCGGSPNTRDHVSSRVFLDEPLPPNLPVVDACEDCNNSFSKHEQYVACLLECVINCSAKSDEVERYKVKKILTENPSLSVRIAKGLTKDDNGKFVWKVEEDRIKTVIMKLARGHAAFQLGLPQLGEPEEISFRPFVVMSDEQRTIFELGSKSSAPLWPEIGSRAFISVAQSDAVAYEKDWLTVQKSRYRYFVDHTVGGLVIQMVLSEYLACRVVWLD
jgi:hypothetical protein